MHLIEALAAGIAGGGNGEVDIFLRGTATRATYYTSFEGDGETTPVAPIPLGTNGQLVVYVNAICDVVVRDSLDNTIREFTSASSATCIEVISDSFLGTAYSGGGSAVNLPTTLAAILNLVNNSFGSTNWQLTGGTNASTGLTAISGIYYNVRSYGAAGDGVTNDRTAILAASAAAQAAGGGTVFFPPGTYIVNATTTMGTLVSVCGAGRDLSTIRVSNATATLVTYGLVEDIGIDTSVNLAGSLVTAQAGQFNRVRFGRASGTSQPTTGALLSLAQAVEYSVTDCLFRPYGATPRAILASSGTLELRLSGSRVEIGSGGASLDTPLLDFTSSPDSVIVVTACAFDTTATSGSGTSAVFADDGPQIWTVSGCSFFISVDAQGVFEGAGGSFFNMAESGNVLLADIGTPYRNFDNTVSRSGMTLRQRTRVYSNNGSLTVDSLGYDSIILERTTNGAGTITMPTAPAGCRLTFTLYNNQASTSGTITLDTATVKMEAASNQFTVAANNFHVFEFRSVVIGTAVYWAQVAEDTVDEPE